MRVDPHDAQQLQGELKAAKLKLQEAKQAELAARFALAAAVQRLYDYRQIDIEFWDDLAADPTYRDFIPVRPPFRPDYPESPAPLAIKEAAPSEGLPVCGGAALDLDLFDNPHQLRDAIEAAQR